MHVKVGLLGILGHYTGCPALELEFAEKSTVGDLVSEIGRRFAATFPEDVWERAENRFNSGISVFMDLQDVEDYGILLRDGSEVLFVTMIAGG